MLYLIRGLPGSGKTTLANDLLDSLHNAQHYEADMYFMVEGEYKWERSKIREAHEWCQNRTRDSLKLGQTVIVSNTFTTLKELQPYFSIALEIGVTPTVYTCHNNWGSIHGVPEETMIAMKKRFQYDISELFEAHHQRLKGDFLGLLASREH